jgi:hypothetical protein
MRYRRIRGYCKAGQFGVLDPKRRANISVWTCGAFLELARATTPPSFRPKKNPRLQPLAEGANLLPVRVEKGRARGTMHYFNP